MPVRGGRGPAETEDEKAELEALKAEVGQGVWEELAGDDYKTRLTEMREIARWESEPVAIYDTKMEQYTGFTLDVRPEQNQQWQAFVRRYLRGSSRPELLAAVSSSKLPFFKSVPCPSRNTNTFAIYSSQYLCFF